MSDETMFERAWRNEGPKPWKDPFEAIRDVVGIPPKMLNPTPAEANLSTAYSIAGSIEVRPRHMGRTAEMDRNYRGPQIIGNWRRRQARQERRKREAILRCKQAYAEAAKEVVASTVGMLGIAQRMFGGRR